MVEASARLTLSLSLSLSFSWTEAEKGECGFTKKLICRDQECGSRAGREKGWVARCPDVVGNPEALSLVTIWGSLRTRYSGPAIQSSVHYRQRGNPMSGLGGTLRPGRLE